MRAATATAILLYKRDPSLLLINLTAETIGSLINFCLDNSYFEFNGDFYIRSEHRRDHGLTPHHGTCRDTNS